ncbi:uncharacterized protein LOC124696337 [Lolium rigidum]|uniref:uncharacterized protein LOC124696337 n=1 Tax=Lolium rigidum TaxID=89674 RepID=UPI001F5DAB3C|nr:uncharacterized protein LOC124696337 [Lolium rigidum]
MGWWRRQQADVDQAIDEEEDGGWHDTVEDAPPPSQQAVSAASFNTAHHERELAELNGVVEARVAALSRATIEHENARLDDRRVIGELVARRAALVAIVGACYLLELPSPERVMIQRNAGHLSPAAPRVDVVGLTYHRLGRLETDRTAEGARWLPSFGSASWVPHITGCLYITFPNSPFIPLQYRDPCPPHLGLLPPPPSLQKRFHFCVAGAMKCSDGDVLGFSVGLGSRKRSPEYPCVSRLRQRRLLALLNRQELYNTFDALICESDALMYPGHLTKLVEAGRWEEAFHYLSRFLPSDRLLSVHGRTLLHFLRVHKAIDDIVAGAPEGRAVSAALKLCFTLDAFRSKGIIKLRAMLWSLVCYTEKRDSLDLDRVRDKAASIIVDLISQTPELKDHMRCARGPVKPHNVLPIGFGFRPRRHVRKRGPIPGSLLVSHYLRKRRMLPSSTSTSTHCEALSFASLIEAKGRMVDLVDTTLKEGKRNQGCPLQSVSNKGAPVGPVSQTNLGASRTPATHSSLSLDTDLELKVREWAVYLTDDRLEAWPDTSQGYLHIRRSVDKGVAQVSQTIPDTWTTPAESSAIPSFTKADAPSLLQVKRPAMYQYGISPVADAGVLPSQAMSAMWPCPYDRPFISTVKNAGALSSKGISNNCASPYEYSVVSIVKNTGTLPSETMSAIGASPSEISLISAVTNAGTHEHFSGEHCYTENGCPGFSPRKNPRMELTTVARP